MSNYRWRQGTTSVAVVCTAALLAACGSSSSSSSSSSSAASTPSTSAAASSTSGAAQSSYNGPEEKYFKTLAAAQKKSGTKLVAGFLIPAGFIPSLVAQQNAAGAEVRALGGSFTAYASNVNVQQQLSQFDDLLAKHANLIMINPVDPAALAPAIKQAKAQGAIVISTNVPADLTQAPVAGITTNVDQAFDYGAFETMQSIAKQMPGTTVGFMGTASPVPQLHYMIAQAKKWAAADGLKIAGEVDAQSDTPAAWSTAATSIVTKYPTAKVIVTYNDNSALAALSAARAANAPNVKVATPNGYTSAAKPEVKAGGIIADYAVPYDEIGQQMAIAGYDALTKSSVKLPRFLTLKGQVATPANVNSVATIG